MDERDVARLHARIEHQRVVQRHDLDDVLARLHDAAYRVGQQALDASAHRRLDRRLVDAVGQPGGALVQRVELARRFGQVAARLVAEGQLGLLDLVHRLLDRALHASDLRQGLVDVALVLRDVALEAQDVDL